MKLLDTQPEFADTYMDFEQAPAFHLAGPNLKYHVVLSSYTIQNVVNGTILATKTDLGYFSDTTNIDISAWIEQLTTYTIPENTPQWKLDLINNVKDLPGQFNLIIELVGVHGN